MWKPLGVEVSLNNMEWNAYQVAKDSGDFMLARSFLFGDYVEPSSMLGSFRCQDPQNESGYCNPAFDGLLQQAADTLDGAARTGLYRKAEQLLMEEMPVIPVYHYNQMRLVAIRPSTACCNRPRTRWMAAHEPDSTARPSNC
ncbi:Dipeptide-binding protein DppE precursor [compost metagenome]